MKIMNIFGIFSCFYSVAYAESFKEIENFKIYAEKAVKDWGAKGLVIGIIDGNEDILWIYSDPSAYQLQSDTILPLASLTKTITAALVAVLVDKGMLNFDDKVIKYIPDFKLYDENATKNLTIRDILSQRTGLPHFSGDTIRKLNGTEKEIREVLAKLPPKKQFGRDYGYQNSFFGLLKSIIEKVTGQSIESVARKYLFAPLKMSSTSYNSPYEMAGFPGCQREKALSDRYAPLYAEEEDIVAKPLGKELWIQSASMGVTSTPNDMMKWLRFCIFGDEKILSKKNFDELRKVHTSFVPKSYDIQFPKERMEKVYYCMGWLKALYANKKEIIFHMGAWNGIRNLLTCVPDKKAGLIVLSNFGGFSLNYLPEVLRNKFVDMLLGINNIDWSQHDREKLLETRRISKRTIEEDWLFPPMGHSDYINLAGTYHNSIYGKLEIIHKNKTLYLKYKNKTLPLTHINANKFKFKSYELGSSFSGFEPGWIEFFDQKNILYCSIMNEGTDPFFKKQ